MYLFKNSYFFIDYYEIITWVNFKGGKSSNMDAIKPVQRKI